MAWAQHPVDTPSVIYRRFWNGQLEKERAAREATSYSRFDDALSGYRETAQPGSRLRETQTAARVPQKTACDYFSAGIGETAAASEFNGSISDASRVLTDAGPGTPRTGFFNITAEDAAADRGNLFLGERPPVQMSAGPSTTVQKPPPLSVEKSQASTQATVSQSWPTPWEQGIKQRQAPPPPPVAIPYPAPRLGEISQKPPTAKNTSMALQQPPWGDKQAQGARSKPPALASSAAGPPRETKRWADMEETEDEYEADTRVLRKEIDGCTFMSFQGEPAPRRLPPAGSSDRLDQFTGSLYAHEAGAGVTVSTKPSVWNMPEGVMTVKAMPPQETPGPRKVGPLPLAANIRKVQSQHAEKKAAAEAEMKAIDDAGKRDKAVLDIEALPNPAFMMSLKDRQRAWNTYLPGEKNGNLGPFELHIRDPAWVNSVCRGKRGTLWGEFLQKLSKRGCTAWFSLGALKMIIGFVNDTMPMTANNADKLWRVWLDLREYFAKPGSDNIIGGLLRYHHLKTEPIPGRFKRVCITNSGKPQTQGEKLPPISKPEKSDKKEQAPPPAGPEKPVKPKDEAPQAPQITKNEEQAPLQKTEKSEGKKPQEPETLEGAQVSK